MVSPSVSDDISTAVEDEATSGVAFFDRVDGTMVEVAAVGGNMMQLKGWVCEVLVMNFGVSGDERPRRVG